jgi:hypothetical protein
MANCTFSVRRIALHVFSRPALWSSGQSSGLQIQRSGFDFRRYQIFWEVVGLEQGPLSLMSTTEELLGRKSSGSGVENRQYGRMDPSRWPRGTLYPQKLALTSPTGGGRSVGIVRSRGLRPRSLFGFCFMGNLRKRDGRTPNRLVGRSFTLYVIQLAQQLEEHSFLMIGCFK